MSGGVIRRLAPAALAISASCGRELLVKMPALPAAGAARHRAVRSRLAEPSGFRMGQPVPGTLG